MTERFSERLIWFFERCSEKLVLNNHKGDWRTLSDEELLELLKQEVEELREALSNNELYSTDIIMECADVANFAMMIASNSALM